MGRWGNELWPDFSPQPRPRPPNTINVAIYSAQVDVDVAHAELRFNEALHPDEILKALLIDDWGSLTLKSWPIAGCTERNRFRLLALAKMAIFLDLAEHLLWHGKPKRPRKRKQPEPADWPRTWAYAHFSATKAARDAGGGPYRSCTFEAKIATSGFVSHDYYLPDDGLIPPGLENDWDTVTFVRAVVQTDLNRRVEAFRRES